LGLQETLLVQSAHNQEYLKRLLTIAHRDGPVWPVA
jgi:hypothetical protein